MHEFQPQETHHAIPAVAIIVAMTRDRLIGADDKLPWHLPEDLRLFRQITSGGTVIMGRATFEAIGRPLANRVNIVLSRSGLPLAGVEVCTGFLEALALAARHNRPVFVIGGRSVYQKALPIASEMHISWVNGPFSGNRFFPEFDLSDWTVLEEKGFQGFRYNRYRRTVESIAPS